MVSLLCSPGGKIGDAVIEYGLPGFNGDKGMSVYQRDQMAPHNVKDTVGISSVNGGRGTRD